jgi:drug/metabolite transporter (DMT)-like permease
MEVVSKPFMAHVSAPVLTFYRVGLGFLFLFSYSLTRMRAKLFSIPDRDFYTMIFIGFLNFFFSMTMLQEAVARTNAATAATIFCSNPVFVLFISVLLKREVFSWTRLTAFIICLAGIVITMFGKSLIIDSGAIYAIAASISFAVYIIINKDLSHKHSGLIINTVASGAGLFFIAIYIMLRGYDFHFSLSEIYGDKTMPFALPSYTLPLIGLLYLGGGISGFGYLTFTKTVRKFSASGSSMIFFLKPLVATLLSIVFLGEHPESGFFAGLFLISSAGAIVVRERLKSKS